MKNENPDLFIDISPVELNSIAARVLEKDAVSATILSANKIGRSVGRATVGIYRVMGTAETSAGEQAWSATAKVLGSQEFARADIKMSAHRELAVYRTGVFAELCGGVRSAACYGIQQRNGLQFLWVEDLSDAPQAPWLPQYYIDTARHLGQFNGHWQEALPAWEWLDQATFRQQFRGQHYTTLFEQLAARQDDPFICRACPPDVTKRLLELWERSDTLFAKVDATPKGVCHGDCHPKNLFPMRASTGKTFTIGIDWEQVGIGCLGLDIGHLLASPMMWLELSLEQAEELKDGIFEAYVAGLREAGWADNEDRVRLAYLTRLGCESFRNMRVVLHFADRVDHRVGFEQLIGHPLEEILSRWAERYLFFLSHFDEALQLARDFE